MATVADVQGFFTAVGHPLTVQQLGRVRAAMATQAYGHNEDVTLRIPTADDFGDWIYRQLRDFCNRVTREEATRAAVVDPADLL